MNRNKQWLDCVKHLTCLCGLTSITISAESINPEGFKLYQQSVFELVNSDFTRGQMAQCQTKPNTEVKTYPALKSSNPLYGYAKFAPVPGENLASGKTYYFVIDENEGTGKGYDRLYIDLNRDCNLANDSSFAIQKNPPSGAFFRASYYKQQICFDAIPVRFDYGADGEKPLNLVPRLLLFKEEGAAICFINPKYWTGDIKIGEEPFTVKLGNDYLITGRYDHPGTALVLSKLNLDQPFADWWGGDRLMAIHKIKGKYYRFSASPTGDRLFVHLYEGEMGTLEIGAGGRKLDKMEFYGSFQAVEKAVPVGGEEGQGGWLSPARKCSLPVGEYLPSYLTVTYGKLQITLSQNYHSEGKPRDNEDRPLLYGIKITKDKPFIFDFSNKPEVMFALPTRNQRVKPGDKVEVKAVLIDPKLDIMIRGINNPSIRVAQETTLPDGTKQKYERVKSLDPTVRILRMNGDKVAEGIMPFG
jgi:hypothetical protein